MQIKHNIFLDKLHSDFVEPVMLPCLHTLARKLELEYLDAARSSQVKMLPSHITRLPSGTESGTYLALDLGGSNLRVAIVHLHNRTVDLDTLRVWEMPEHVRTTTDADAFFGWIAECVKQTTQCKNAIQDTIKMGISWSFPFEQTAIGHARLHAMGKGFRLQSIVGQDMYDLFMAGFKQAGLYNIEIVAVLNDAVATLLSSAYRESTTRVGLICGTGTNATCMLPIADICKSKLPFIPHERGALVNAEWSMYGHQSLPFTQYDRDLNSMEEIPGYQPFELMISGRTLGEIVRLVLLDAHDTYNAFGWETVPKTWRTRWGVPTFQLSQIDHDDLDKVKTFLKSAHPQTYSEENVQLVRTICEAVSIRASKLLATGIFALVKVSSPFYKQNENHNNGIKIVNNGNGKVLPTVNGVNGKACGVCFDKIKDLQRLDERIDDMVTVSYTGAVLEKYPRFRGRVQDTLDALTKGNYGRICLEHCDEGGVVGAAVLAGMYANVS